MVSVTATVIVLAVLRHTSGQQQQEEQQQRRPASFGADGEWKCPEVRNVSCACDLPHTLRCTGGKSTFETVAQALRHLSGTSSISLLDCTVQNVGSLPARLLEGVSLHGLVVSSGEIKSVSDTAFDGLASPLQALGLPNNQLERVPSSALATLNGLERLDLSHNRLHTVHNNSFKVITITSFPPPRKWPLYHVPFFGFFYCSYPTHFLRASRLRGTSRRNKRSIIFS